MIFNPRLNKKNLIYIYIYSCKYLSRNTNHIFNKIIIKNTDRRTIEKKMKKNRSKKMSPNIKKNDKIFTIK
jgi:hypothetical protein